MIRHIARHHAPIAHRDLKSLFKKSQCKIFLCYNVLVHLITTHHALCLRTYTENEQEHHAKYPANSVKYFLYWPRQPTVTQRPVRTRTAIGNECASKQLKFKGMKSFSNNAKSFVPFLSREFKYQSVSGENKEDTTNTLTGKCMNPKHLGTGERPPLIFIQNEAFL